MNDNPSATGPSDLERLAAAVAVMVESGHPCGMDWRTALYDAQFMGGRWIAETADAAEEIAARLTA